MAQIKEFNDEIVQLSRLGLEGKTEDVRLFLSRFSRKLKKKDEALHLELGELLKLHSPLVGKSALRKKSPDVQQPENISPDAENNLLRRPSLVDIKDPLLSTSNQLVITQLLQEQSRIDELNAAGISPTRSAIFTGPPGVGKTHTAKWIAKQLNVPLYILDVATVMSSFLGRTGANLKEALSFAKNTPCILLLDEIDAIAKRRSDETDVGELKRLVTVILQEVDEWNSSSLLLAATNHKELIDPALWRRFDLVTEFELPDIEKVGASVERFLVEDFKYFEKYLEILKICHIGLSYSEVEKSIENIRRAKFLGVLDVKTSVLQLVSDRVEKLSKEDRSKLAKTMTKAKAGSQRYISEATGIHRDTIRKMRTTNKIK